MCIRDSSYALIMPEYIQKGYEISAVSTILFYFPIIATGICFLSSATFHLMYCLSESARNIFILLDFFGIALTIAASVLTSLHFGYFCYPRLQIFYDGIYIAIFCYTGYLFTQRSDPNFKQRIIRNFVTSVIYPVLPLTHWVILRVLFTDHPDAPEDVHIFLWRIILMWVIYGVGFAIYATKFPECLKPGLFDIIGHSHQLWHLCVVVASLWVLFAIHLRVFEYRHATPCLY
eukprot:TRINITY_DN14203_c0_g1_i1.p1 TRINITY_DN14203_c0_g1~~TRINITY_DN14203_c0_g1_i1.p1  ORF type:complete len:232 (-),score=2.77 TRINITY_DN14203_c0_g1_i1:263-958(-)